MDMAQSGSRQRHGSRRSAQLGQECGSCARQFLMILLLKRPAISGFPIATLHFTTRELKHVKVTSLTSYLTV